MADPSAPPSRPSQLDQFIAEPAGDGLRDGAPVELREQRSFSPDTRGTAGEPPPAPRQDTGDHDAGGEGAGDEAEPAKPARGEKLGSEIAQARVDLGDAELRSPDVGGAGAAGGTGPVAGDLGAHGAGLGASLGLGDPAPGSVVQGADPDQAENEQADARLAHLRAQGGKPEWTALDQSRAEGVVGSINDQDGN